MKKENRDIYRCDHCNKVYLSKYWCEYHEKRCSSNPQNDRACFGCSHLTYEKDYIYSDGYDGSERELQVSAYFCNKLEKYVIPPKAEHKGNAYEFSEYLNENMPKECEHRKDLIDTFFNEVNNV